MKRILLAGAVLAAGTALFAYGVSPSQYTQGRAQDRTRNGLPVAPPPQPMSGNAIPGAQPARVQFQQNSPTQNYDEVPVPDWAKAWHHYHWSEAKAAWESKDALFLDARAKVEYDQAHIPGALPLPLGQFDKYYKLYESRIKHAKHLITYCHGAGCQLSNKVAQKLWQKGYRDVGSFFGGWPEWQQHNMPVETGPGPKH